MEDISSHSEAVVQDTLVTLPVEVLVYIFSFLSTRDKVRIRCISKALRSVSEIPSLWEDFVWSRYAPRDEKLLKHVLKTFGKYVKRIHFADHIAPSKLEVMLKFCKNVIHLSLPSFYYGYLEKLEKIVHRMENVQILDILVTVFSTDVIFIQQCFALSNNLKEVTLYYCLQSPVGFCATIRQCLEEWGNNNYVPRKLNFFTGKCMAHSHSITSSLQSCVPVLRNKALLKSSDSEDIAQVSIYLKTSTYSSTTIPFIQLRVTDSLITLSVVKANKFGILGLPFDTLQLTEGSYRGKKVQKALLTASDCQYIDTSVTNLAFVTYFDASICAVLYPGHLEQLSIACPNLQRLNLTRNYDCLNNLQGLHSLADNCRSLQALSLLEIHACDCEYYSCIQLWEILCTMRLTELAIEICMINIYDRRKTKSVAKGAQVKHQQLNDMFQRYSSLRILEVGIQHLRSYQTCYNPSDNDLLLLTNFPSITCYRLCNLPSNNCYHTLKRIFCQKYLRCLFLSKTLSGILSLSLEGHCSSLQQVYIHSRNTVPTEAFIDGLCGHGGLEHVILCVKSLTAKSIETLIECSSNLVTFRVYLYSRAFLKAQLKQLTTAIKRKFSKRKLFNGGNFDVQVSYGSATVEVNQDTDLLSVWESD